MKNFKSIAAIAFAATVMLASCGKEEVGGGKVGDGTTDVKISFSYAKNTGTRAEGPAASTGQAEFQPGHIFFVTAGSGMIDKHVPIVAADATNSATIFTIAELNAGEVVVEGVSSSAKECYILSNDGAVFTGSDAISSSLEGTSISTVLEKQIAVGAMNDSPSTIANVPMYGMGTVSTATTGTTAGGKDYAASVNVGINSLASRIQIGKFTTSDYTAPNGDVFEITAFTVAGIYINNTFDKMTFASTVADATAPEINNDSDVAKYSKTAGTTDYIAAGTANTLADEPAAVAADVSGVMTADQSTATNFWAYNVFPKGLPHIIVKLSNIKYTITPNGGSAGAEQTIPTAQWLTINSYKKAGDTALTAFEANNIYSLGGTTGGIDFSFDDLTDEPYTEELDVLVTVDMFDWVDTPIDWNN